MKRSYSDIYGKNYTSGGKQAVYKKKRLSGMDKQAVDREVVRVLKAKADKRVCNYSFANAYVGSNGSTVSLYQNLTLGDASINQASGQKMDPLGVTVRRLMEAAPVLGSATELWSSGRILIYQWFGNVAPGANSILGNIGNANAPLSYKNWNLASQFKILADTGPIVFNIQADGSGGNGYTACGTLYVKGRKLRQTEIGSTGSIQKNDIGVLMISDGAASPGLNFQWQSQVVFADDI